MARGKYSPTVSAAYAKDQSWWSKLSKADEVSEEYHEFDADGYDSYGYNKDGVDRAGYEENEYMMSDDEHGNNWRYDQGQEEWGFDGTRPVTR